MKVSFEIDLSDLDTFDEKGYNLLDFFRTGILCVPLERRLEVLHMGDGPMKTALLRHYDQEIIAAKRILKSIEIER